MSVTGAEPSVNADTGAAGDRSPLRGRALLTGASGGIGGAIARALAARGATVVLTGRRTEALEPLAQEIGGEAVAADLAERDAVARLAERAGEVDLLVANAGLPGSGHLDSFSGEEIDRALDVNLRAPIQLARALVPGMIERGGGHVVLVSSLAGKTASSGSSIYSATKFGLRGFALGLRADLDGAGVGVSTVLPGFIRDAGMFHDSGARLPPGIGTRTPGDVAAAVVSAVERNRAEVDVAPLPVRAVAAFAVIAPATAQRIGGRRGGRLARNVAAGQRDKR